MPEFHAGLIDRMHAENEELLGKVRDGDWSDETQDALRTAIHEFADDFGYDLDEEGQALEEREVGETTREDEGIRDGDGDRERDGEAGAVRAEGEQQEEEEAAAPA